MKCLCPGVRHLTDYPTWLPFITCSVTCYFLMLSSNIFWLLGVPTFQMPSLGLVAPQKKVLNIISCSLITHYFNNMLRLANKASERMFDVCWALDNLVKMDIFNCHVKIMVMHVCQVIYFCDGNFQRYWQSILGVNFINMTFIFS